MYRERKDTYWFQPAIVRIAYRMSSLELSYFGHVFVWVCGCVGVWGRDGLWTVTTNGWPVPASPFSCLCVCCFFMVVTSAAPRRDNPIAPGLLAPHACGKDTTHMVHALLAHYFATSSTEFELDLCSASGVRLGSV